MSRTTNYASPKPAQVPLTREEQCELRIQDQLQQLDTFTARLLQDAWDQLHRVILSDLGLAIAAAKSIGREEEYFAHFKTKLAPFLQIVPAADRFLVKVEKRLFTERERGTNFPEA